MRALLGLLLLTPGLSAQDITLESLPTRWRFTAERFDIDAKNDLTLFGAHFDLLGIVPDFPSLYAGVGGFGAVEGQTGGLFVGGVTGGYLRELYPGWTLDLGLFAGAGGGGGADSGSGLMLRPHVALEYALGMVALRVEAVHVEFPDGQISDTHLAVGLSLPGEILLARPGRAAGTIPPASLLWRRIRVTPSVLWLDPKSTARKKSGGPVTDEIGMVGGELDYFLSDVIYLPVEAYAAAAGAVSGFALVLGGIGVSVPLVDPLWFEGKVLGGAAGGGDLNTGGGFVYEASGGLSARIARNISVQALAGYFNAPGGDLESVVYSAGISWNPRSAELAMDYPRSRLAGEGLSGDVALLEDLRVKALHKTYFPAGAAVTKAGLPYDDALHLAGVGLELPFDAFGEAFAFTGRTFVSYAGGVGGYGELLGGVKYELTPDKSRPEHTFTAQLEGGASGGGGVDVASGLLWVMSAGYRYQWTPQLALTVEGGSFEADRGSFHGELLQFGLEWTLSRAHRR